MYLLSVYVIGKFSYFITTGITIGCLVSLYIFSKFIIWAHIHPHLYSQNIIFSKFPRIRIFFKIDIRVYFQCSFFIRTIPSG